MRFVHHLMLLTALIPLSASPSFAQSAADYPSKPVRVIVAGGAGGGTDIQARMYAQKLSENMKRSFVVENRPGAGGTIGFAYVAQSAPDGYTVMMVNPAFTFAPALFPAAPLDPVKQFTPISLVNKFTSMIVVHPSLPVKSIKELIALAKARPGVLDWAVSQGTTNHLFTAYFVSEANIKVTFVTYKGGDQDAIDVVAGRVPMIMGNLVSYLPHVKSGKLRALAVTTADRSPVMPEVPTISESGLRGFEASGWQGWVAPAGTPASIVGKLSEELARAVRSPDIMKRLTDDGAVPVGSTPDQFRQLITEEISRWNKVVKDSGIRMD